LTLASRNLFAIVVRWEDSARFDGKTPSFAPFAAPLFKNVKDAIVHRHASPSFFRLAVRYEDHAGFPIQVLDAHPVKLSFVPHAGIAHQDDDVPEKLKAAFPPIAGSGARQQFLFRFIVKPEWTSVFLHQFQFRSVADFDGGDLRAMETVRSQMNDYRLIYNPDETPFTPADSIVLHQNFASKLLN